MVELDENNETFGFKYQTIGDLWTQKVDYRSAQCRKAFPSMGRSKCLRNMYLRMRTLRASIELWLVMLKRSAPEREFLDNID